MTPDEGYRLAKYQRPGVVIVMGPSEAREQQTQPLPAHALSRLPGDASLWSRDMRNRLGVVPSLWAQSFAIAAIRAEHNLSDDEWRWLHGPATLVKAQAWLATLTDNTTPLAQKG